MDTSPPLFKVYTFLGIKHFYSAWVADAAIFLSGCVSNHPCLSACILFPEFGKCFLIYTQPLFDALVASLKKEGGNDIRVRKKDLNKCKWKSQMALNWKWESANW